MRKLALLALLLLGGCSRSSEPLERVEKKIDSWDAIEQQILNVERTVRERDAAERIYSHLYNEREQIVDIAEGHYDNSPVHRAIIREMAWVTLGELRRRKPQFEIRVEREAPKPQAKAPPKPNPEQELK